jgi:hypothetical protein
MYDPVVVSCEHGNESWSAIKVSNCFGQLNEYQLLKMELELIN